MAWAAGGPQDGIRGSGCQGRGLPVENGRQKDRVACPGMGPLENRQREGNRHWAYDRGEPSEEGGGNKKRSRPPHREEVGGHEIGRNLGRPGDQRVLANGGTARGFVTWGARRSVRGPPVGPGMGARRRYHKKSRSRGQTRDSSRTVPAIPPPRRHSTIEKTPVNGLGIAPLVRTAKQETRNTRPHSLYWATWGPARGICPRCPPSPCCVDWAGSDPIARNRAA